LPGYKQELFLGRGAFGAVWKAIDSNGDRAVAIRFYSHRDGLDSISDRRCTIHPPFTLPVRFS